MSDRERWIVYPLLFLSLGVSLHDKMLPSKEVKTHRMILVNDDERGVVQIDGVNDAGVISGNLRGSETIESWSDLEALLRALRLQQRANRSAHGDSRQEK
jgi:hypothetical protein